MAELIIRPMKEADITQVLEVEQQAFSTPWSRQAFEMEMRDNNLAYYLVVEKDGRIIGYGGMWLVIDEAHVTNIAILPAYRGCRIGEKLLRAMMDAAVAVGIQRMTLEVRESNAPARRLYTRLGFVVRGRRPGYYTDLREDALVMWKDPL